MENKIFPQYDSMTTEELEEIIRLDSYLEDEQRRLNVDELLYISGILAERARAAGEWTDEDTERSFREFKKYYAPEFYGLKPPSKISFFLFRLRRRIRYKLREIKSHVRKNNSR